jgi:hypothetical protein
MNIYGNKRIPAEPVGGTWTGPTPPPPGRPKAASRKTTVVIAETWTALAAAAALAGWVQLAVIMLALGCFLYVVVSENLSD